MRKKNSNPRANKVSRSSATGKFVEVERTSKRTTGYTVCNDSAPPDKKTGTRRTMMVTVKEGDLVAVLYKLMNAESMSEVAKSKVEASKLIRKYRSEREKCA